MPCLGKLKALMGISLPWKVNIEVTFMKRAEMHNIWIQGIIDPQYLMQVQELIEKRIGWLQCVDLLIVYHRILMEC